uniref:Uncharacterized protein n=1 Tax=Rangifer tarandus platyrhynchus TaxID=3082113 RepID=A0ACB0DYD5_RANTA|nr:unnamed protein product [Rangifer tarandus platyrhynchus]
MEREVETGFALETGAHSPAELEELPTCRPQLPVQEGGDPELVRGWEREQRLGQGPASRAAADKEGPPRTLPQSHGQDPLRRGGRGLQTAVHGEHPLTVTVTITKHAQLAFARTRSSPHLANTLGWKAASVCSLPSGDRGFTSGPGAWPLETQEALPREGPASVFSDCKGATLPLKSGGHGLSPAQQRASSPANVSVPPGR